MNDIYLTPSQVAEALGLSGSGVRQRSKPGAAVPLEPDLVISGRRYYRLSSIREYAREHGYVVNPSAPVVPMFRQKRGYQKCQTP